MRPHAIGAAAVMVAAISITMAGTANAQGASVTASTQTADPDYATALTLQGKGFQSVKNGHGGIYVFFGWVSDPDGGSWRPSKGGASGTTFRYVQDRETKDNSGYQRFVAFPGSDTEQSANGGVLAANGTWSTRLNVPGARFKAADRAGTVSEVDCTKVRCGVITVGAHGVVNANNETFTPISFTAPKPAQQPPAPPKTTTAATTTPPAKSTTVTSPAPTSTVELSVTSETPVPQPASQAQQLSPESGPNLWLLTGILVLAVIAPGVWLLLRRRSKTVPTEGREQ